MSSSTNNVREEDACGSSGCKNTKAFLQILGTGMDTQDTSPSVLLSLENEKFIFNAGEGLQRFCAEHKQIKLSQVNHICLTRVCSETASGLPGFLLTLAGMEYGNLEKNKGEVDIWGPLNLGLLVDAMGNFMHDNTTVNVKVHVIKQSDNGMVHEDCNAQAPSLHSEELQVVGKFKAVSISAIILTPTHLAGSYFNSNDTSIVYVCELHATRGKFDNEKAKELGLIEGKKRAQLVKGFTVKSDLLDIEVHPNDVISPPIPGPIVLIVDCPTEPHAQELFSSKALDAYYSDVPSNGTEMANVVNCVVHLSPATIVTSPAYEKWMRKFGSAEHVMARATRKWETPPVLESSAILATRMHYLCPRLFPVPILAYIQNNDVISPSFKGAISKDCGVYAENLLKYTLHPPGKLGFDRCGVKSRMTSSMLIEELLSEIPEIADAAKDVTKIWHSPKDDEMELFTSQGEVTAEEPSLVVPRCLENVQRDDLEIVFLGTGCAIPSKYRNVTSIYVNLFSKGGLLLDCGEGTLAQLKRRYGLDGADSAVRNLKFIWISHKHADHHAGLARILVWRRDLLKGVPHEPLLVIAPKMVLKFLKEYEEIEDLDVLFFDCWSTTMTKWDNMEADSEGTNDDNRDHFLSTSLSEDSSPLQCPKRLKLCPPVDDITLLKYFKKVLSETSLERIISFPVVHCKEAYGVILESTERMNCGKLVPGWKIVYSGDSRPCPQVIEASVGATILIHEATFEDALVEEAIAKAHSTINEAIEVGQTAGAYRIILTHFSQRYPKIPALDEVSIQNTCIAFDLMSVNLADLPMLPKVLPYLKLLFRNEG